MLAEVGRIRVAQKVFLPQSVTDEQSVPADEIHADGGPLTIDEGVMIPMIEIGAPFALTQTQIEKEASSHTGRTLAKQAARLVALAEDLLLFQGAPVPLPAGVVTRNQGAVRDGLLGDGDAIDPVAVQPRDNGDYV